jgi:hypothetical protein
VIVNAEIRGVVTGDKDGKFGPGKLSRTDGPRETLLNFHAPPSSLPTSATCRTSMNNALAS